MDASGMRKCYSSELNAPKPSNAFSCHIPHFVKRHPVVYCYWKSFFFNFKQLPSICPSYLAHIPSFGLIGFDILLNFREINIAKGFTKGKLVANKKLRSSDEEILTLVNIGENSPSAV